DDELSRLLDGFKDRRPVEGSQSSNVNHLSLDAVVSQHGRSLHRLVDHQEVSHDGRVSAWSQHFGLAERDEVFLLWNHTQYLKPAFLLPRALAAVEQFVLEEDHRVVIADSGLEEALGIIGV